MADLDIGDKAPDFTLPSTSGNKVTLSALKGKKVVLYFYPKDCTSGCTLESQDFRDHQAEFEKLNTVVLGISRDSIKSHYRFIEKESLNFELLSDEDEIVCKLYDVMKDKVMYGKKVRGIERSTFLINEKGFIQALWRKVKVDGHVKEVLAAIKV
jgi:peroxiredoxin Q/BCP